MSIDWYLYIYFIIHFQLCFPTIFSQNTHEIKVIRSIDRLNEKLGDRKNLKSLMSCHNLLSICHVPIS